jgi:hypothetical protein
MPKFTLEKPKKEEEPISVVLVQECDGDIRIDLQRGNVKAEVLRLTRYGRVATIMGQAKELEALGMKVDQETGTILVC